MAPITHYLIHLSVSVAVKLPDALVMYVCVRGIVSVFRGGEKDVKLVLRRHSKHHSGHFRTCVPCKTTLNHHQQQESAQLVVVDLIQ